MHSIKPGAGKALSGIGKKLDKAGEAVGNVADKAGKAVKKATDYAKGTYIGGKITNFAKFTGKGVKKLKGKADNIRERTDKFKEKHPGLMKKINGAKTLGKNTLRKSMPIALNMMGMAMSYSTGSSGVMEAIGVGSGLQHGFEGMMASSQETLEGNVEGGAKDDIENNESVQAVEKDLEENADQIEETKEQLESTNEEIKDMSKEDQEKGKDYSEYEALDEREKELMGKKPDDLTEKELEELKSIAARKEELKENHDEVKDNASITEVFDRKRKLEKQLEGQRGQRKELQAKLKSTKKDAMQEIIKQYRNNGDAAQIARAKNEITKKIQMCMLERKYQDKQGDVTADYTLSDKETRSAERMQESISALVDRAIVSGGGRLDTGEIFKKYFGEDSDSPMAESLKQAIDAYQFQARAKNYNDNEELYTSTGGTKEKFENDIISKVSKH